MFSSRTITTFTKRSCINLLHAKQLMLKKEFEVLAVSGVNGAAKRLETTSVGLTASSGRLQSHRIRYALSTFFRCVQIGFVSQ